MIQVRTAGFLLLIFLFLISGLCTARTPIVSSTPSADHAIGVSIAPGTRITLQNWRQYSEFMPHGMQTLFEGKYFWKMPADVELDVGPTIIHPLPKGYNEATERVRGQTKLIAMRDGRLNIEGYRGGLPFPDATEPHIGWKILAQLLVPLFSLSDSKRT